MEIGGGYGLAHVDGDERASNARDAHSPSIVREN